MNLKDKIKKFNQRWKIPNLNTNPGEEFSKFKVRVLNFMHDIDSHVSESSAAIFCRFLGIPEKWHHDRFDPYSRAWGTNIKDRLIEENNETEFYKLLEIIFSLNIQSRSNYQETTYSKDILYAKLLQSLDFSDVNLATTKLENGGIIFHPKGEELLDKELVDKIMEFLNKNSNSHFVDALKFYQSKKYIKSAESLRRTLEEFLRFKLDNKKGLGENKVELGKALKTKKSDAQIRNIISQVLGYLDQYFNENSKHNDGELDDTENEFLIYQTGLLLRYINQLF